MSAFAKRYPLLFSGLILLLQILLYGPILKAIHPLEEILYEWLFRRNEMIMGYSIDQMAGLVAILPFQLFINLITVFVVTKLHWWKEIDVLPLAKGHHLHLYLIPLITTLLVLLPLAGFIPIFALSGFLITPLTVLWLFLSYLPLGFEEETFNRGIIQTALSRYNAMTVAFISAILFGVMHTAHFIVGDQTTLQTTLQIFRAIAWGFGMSALRIRTGTIVPLMMLHGINNWLEDMTWRTIRASSYSSGRTIWITQQPVILQYVIDELPYYLMGLYGLYLLWNYRRHEPKSTHDSNQALPATPSTPNP